MYQRFKAILSDFLITYLPTNADNGYDNDFIDLVEIVYGEGYLSQGGPAMVDQMFEGITLEGKSVLYLGCGIGGPALHLVKNHQVALVGVDPEKIMIQKCQEALAKTNATANAALKGSADFVLMENPFSLQQFPSGAFDIITSKEAILHVPHEQKPGYFREIFRVLKNGGQIVILDWQHSDPNYSDDLKAMMEMDGVPFNLTTPEEYRQVLMKAGFSNITINDITNQFAEQTQQDLALIEKKQEQIIVKFGKETYDYACKSWNIQGKAFKEGELLAGIIKAKKL